MYITVRIWIQTIWIPETFEYLNFFCVLCLFCIRCWKYNKHKSCFGRLSIGNGDLNFYTGFDGDAGDLLHDLGREVKVDHALVDVHLWIPKFLKFGFQMVWYLNGWSIGYVLSTRSTIWIPDQHMRKQDAIYLCGIQMVGLSCIHVAFENQTIWHLTSFWPFNGSAVPFSCNKFGFRATTVIPF